jgi:hypothetical protein
MGMRADLLVKTPGRELHRSTARAVARFTSNYLIPMRRLIGGKGSAQRPQCSHPQVYVEVLQRWLETSSVFSRGKIIHQCARAAVIVPDLLTVLASLKMRLKACSSSAGRCHGAHDA